MTDYDPVLATVLHEYGRYCASLTRPVPAEGCWWLMSPHWHYQVYKSTGIAARHLLIPGRAHDMLLGIPVLVRPGYAAPRLGQSPQAPRPGALTVRALSLEELMTR